MDVIQTLTKCHKIMLHVFSLSNKIMSRDRIKMMWIIDTVDTYHKFHNKFSFSQILLINFTINLIIVKIINCDINT